MPSKKMVNVDIESEALNLVNTFVSSLDRSTIFVTEKVSFDVRKLIEKCRKNYWGVFDTPFDEQTGREKTFIPLTESMTESVVKNIDIDTKDINVRGETPNDINDSRIVRYKLKDYLDEINFGEKIDVTTRQLAIDGTIVWKTVLDDKGRPVPVMVDLLNFFIDPLAESIDKTPGVCERALLDYDEFMSMSGWINKKDVATTSNSHPNDRYLTADRNQKAVEIFEYWGLMPKYLISGNKKDTEMIEGHIVVSKGNVHLIETNKNKIKPYEECWYRRCHGRWYGKGVAEMLLALQIYLNTTVNIRITRAYLSQMGLFKIRRGSGITPQTLSRLAVNGAIEVNSRDDIEQFVMQEASQASYNDENNIQTWAGRLTSAFEMASGERLPSGTTATVGTIQAAAVQSQFILVKEGIGMFLQRWLNRQVMNHLYINMDDLLTITGLNDEDLQSITEDIARNIVSDKAEKGMYSSYGLAQMDYQHIVETLKKQKDIFIKADKKIPLSKFESKVYVSNEEIDKGVMLQNLIQALSFAPEYKEPIVRAVFDLMGLDMPKFNLAQLQAQQAQATMGPDMNSQMRRPTTSKNPTAMMQEANTM